MTRWFSGLNDGCTEGLMSTNPEGVYESSWSWRTGCGPGHTNTAVVEHTHLLSTGVEEVTQPDDIAVVQLPHYLQLPILEWRMKHDRSISGKKKKTQFIFINNLILLRLKLNRKFLSVGLEPMEAIYVCWSEGGTSNQWSNHRQRV